MVPNKLKLANIPTPIESVKFNGAKFLMKRDDFTGSELSGNKIRKLEYLLYAAKKAKADVVYTCGGEQSNHARATAIAAAKLGLQSRLFLWGRNRKSPNGNLFFNQLLNCKIDFVNKEEYSRIDEIMLQAKLQDEKKGKKIVIIPEGGSSSLGVWGYIDFVKELNSQIESKKISGILTASGSGGTTAGLLLGSELMNLSLRIYSVNVLYPEDVIREKIKKLFNECNANFNLKLKFPTKRLIILPGYSNEGYKHIEPQKIGVLKSFYSQTGTLLDPTYTGKAFVAFNKLFLEGKKSSRILFVHTGGLFGVFPKTKEYLL